MSNATGSTNLVLQTASALIALFIIFLGGFKPIVREFLNSCVMKGGMFKRSGFNRIAENLLGAIVKYFFKWSIDIFYMCFSTGKLSLPPPEGELFPLQYRKVLSSRQTHGILR